MLFEEKDSGIESFWTTKVSQVPSNLDYQSFVTVKKQKSFLKDFSVRWLGLKYPFLYFADVTTSSPPSYHL